MDTNQLIQLGKETLAKKTQQREKDKKYNKVYSWKLSQYKAFAIGNGFRMPETPEELK